MVLSLMYAWYMMNEENNAGTRHSSLGRIYSV